MTRLTDKERWEWSGDRPEPQAPPATRSGIKARLVDKYFGPVRNGYQNYHLYDVVCRKHLPRGPLKAIEVGSAPGLQLVAIHRRFGYEPYGVEYTKSGVEANKKVFTAHDLNPDNVIHADFFDESFRRRYRDFFDLVMSHGFIEHFTNVAEVVEGHGDLLKPGGHLLLTIPNLRGLNYRLCRFFTPGALETHNLTIMKKSVLRSFLPEDRFDILECLYLGITPFPIFWGAEPGRFKETLLKLGLRTDELLGAVAYLFFKNGTRGIPWFSPKLLILGRKKA